MLRGIRLCAGVAIVSACAVDVPTTAQPHVAVGGDSPLVARFARIAAEAHVPAQLLAATSYVTTRFELGAGHGFALPPDEASLRAGAALLQTPGAVTPADYLPALRALGGDALATEVATALSRGIAGRDEQGARIIVAAEPIARARTTAAAASADYAGATWQAASASNYQVAARGLTAIDHIVIHDTEGGFSGTIGWFQDPTAKVSAHYVVKSSDGEIVQMVAEKNIAWHDKCFNTNTVGIEHEGYAAHADVWYTEAMYMQSAKLTAYLADKYGIAKMHGTILGHGEAPDCSDHTDPGPGWNWAHYIDLVNTGGAPHFAAGSPIVDAPAALTSGELATVTVTLTNDGNAAWDLDATRLGTAAPADRDSALFVAGAWPSPSRPAAVDAVVAPGASGTFTFQILAPDVTAPTLFDEAFQPVEEGVGPFGPEIHVAVTVSPAAGTGETPPDGGCNTARGGGMVPVLAGLVVVLLDRRRRRRRV